MATEYKYNPFTGNFDIIVSPSGADTQIQFNDNGVFGGDANLTWSSANNLLGVVATGTDIARYRLTHDGGNFTISLTSTTSPTFDLNAATNEIFFFRNIGAGALSVDIDGFARFDGINKRLGVGLTSPSEALHVEGKTIFKNTVDEDTWFKLAAGNTAEQRTYLAFMDRTNTTHQWLTGKNATNDFILFQNSPNALHRGFYHNAGATDIMSSGTNPVRINYAYDVSETDCGTGFEVYDGINRNKLFSVEGVSGVSRVGIGTGGTPGGKMEIQLNDGGDTATGLLIDNNDVTNNPKAMRIENATSSDGLFLSQTGTLATGQYGIGGEWASDNTNGTTFAYFFSNFAHTNNSVDRAVFKIANNNPASLATVFRTYQAGQGKSLSMTQTGNGEVIDIAHTDTGTNASVDLTRTGNNAGNITALRVTASNSGAGDAYPATFTGGNVGIGTTTPTSTLQVNGGVQVADDSDIASANKVGTLRYRADVNNSYVDMCMQTGASTYEWINIVQNNW